MQRQVFLISVSILFLSLFYTVIQRAHFFSSEIEFLVTIEHPAGLNHTISRNRATIWNVTLKYKAPRGTPKKPSIFFDRSVYCPEVDVFWNSKYSLIPIEIALVDRYVEARSVKVKISSSLDAKKVTLMKVSSGRFEGSILSRCLRLGEPASNETVFNAGYGDKIIVKCNNQVQGTAFVVFPNYIMIEDKASVSLDQWKLFDSEGVPLVNYGPPIGVQYNPVTVCNYALACYLMYVTTEDSAFRETFLVQANWLVRKAEYRGNFSVWEYRFDWPDYQLTDPWVSAMAQGEGLSVLVRAYFLTGNTTYLEVAETAMRSFEVEMDSGGVRYTDSGGVWYEEGADADVPSSKVLNGFLFALFGLYEYSFATNNTKGYTLFYEGTQTLSLNLHRYDSGTWSYYDLLYCRPASLGYHKLHVDQLLTLYRLTGDQTFLEYSKKFNSYIH